MIQRLKHLLSTNCAIWLVIAFLMFLAEPLKANSFDDGYEAYQTGALDTSVSIWRKLAADGDRDAQYALGILYLTGKGVVANEIQSTVYFLLAAENGHVQAMFNLGLAMWEGRGITQDHAKAVHWWRKAADLGDIGASHNLAIAYLTGIGVKQDIDQGMEWLDKANDAGHPKARDVFALFDTEISNSKVSTETTIQSNADKRQISNSTPAKPATGGSTLKSSNQEDTQNTRGENNNQTFIAGPRLTASVTRKTGPENSQQRLPDKSGQNINSTRVTDKTSKIPIEAANDVVTLQGQKVSVYAWPQPDLQPFDVVPGGTTININNRTKNWAKITVPRGFKVWVHSAFVTRLPSGLGQINATSVRARPSPSTAKNSPPIGTLNKDTATEILEVEKDWLRIRAPSALGAWVKLRDLSKL